MMQTFTLYDKNTTNVTFAKNKMAGVIATFWKREFKINLLLLFLNQYWLLKESDINKSSLSVIMYRKQHNMLVLSNIPN
jgi:hypothetical protein